MTDYLVLGLHQAAWIVTRRHMAETNVVLQRSEQRDALANQHGNASDYQALNEAGAQKALDCFAAIDVQVGRAGCGEPRNDVGRIPVHLFYIAAFGGG